jgi:hypothetical protein
LKTLDVAALKEIAKDLGIEEEKYKNLNAKKDLVELITIALK